MADSIHIKASMDLMKNMASLERSQKVPTFEMGRYEQLAPVYRSISKITDNLRTLGVNIDQQTPIMQGIRASLITYELYTGAVMAYRGLIEAAKLKEYVQAAILTGINAGVPGMQWRIPVALGAAAMVGAAFGVGFSLGSHPPSSTNKSVVLEGGDIANPVDRRHMQRNLEQHIGR